MPELTLIEQALPKRKWRCAMLVVVATLAVWRNPARVHAEHVDDDACKVERALRKMGRTRWPS